MQARWAVLTSCKPYKLIAGKVLEEGDDQRRGKKGVDRLRRMACVSFVKAVPKRNSTLEAACLQATTTYSFKNIFFICK